ncbi:MAG TPA: tol-pal system protein YbgF [Rhizobiaceae bacterium]|nr:tol-pal system protein YbgF [Rhizobiaceae bacterium]
MKLTRFRGAAVGLLIASGTAAAAAAPATTEVDRMVAFGSAFMEARVPAPKIRVPGPRNQEEGRIILAQAGDPRVTQLEEQVRQLNGLVEELNFQILQMQEQLRKMQEDNEFRFQELEQRRSDAGGSAPRNRDTARSETAQPPQVGQTARNDTIEQIIETPNGTLNQPPATADQSTSPRLGEPPRTFGRITFDANGNIVGGAAGDPAPARSGGLPGVESGPSRPDQTTVAALPGNGDPEALYRDSYQFILSGDYATAETGFRQLVESHKDSARIADAQFWLGEAQLAQGKNREAAQTFLAANREHPNAPKAPDTMLKLGMALAAMKQKDVACATFAEVSKRYPKASPAILDRAKQEQGRASC